MLFHIVATVTVVIIKGTIACVHQLFGQPSYSNACKSDKTKMEM